MWMKKLQRFRRDTKFRPHFCSLLTLFKPRIQGDPEKQQRDTSHNMWMQSMVSVYEVTSPEKNDTKISHFGSVVCFLGHIL